MNVKKWKSWTAWLLALALFASSFSASTTRIHAEEPAKKAVLSLDAGRKYFSLDQLKYFVDRANALGFTDIQLILGNDGLRFLLDDMSIQAGDSAYADEAVRAGILAGNRHYYDDPNGTALTQAEMDEFLAYAEQNNIGIIPVINSPGHMDAILYAMESVGIEHPSFQQSTRTVDLENEQAVAFTQALINKYMAYFSDHCEIFNIGCDEYANDVDTGGWAKLQASGGYERFVNYVNALCQQAKAHGLRCMCFNDGIYYHENDSFGTFDPSLIISYWTGGWWGYDVAKPAFFAAKGHALLNTNDGWYYVLGHNDAEIYNYNNSIKNMEKLDFNDLPKGNGEPTIGSMFCIWCDEPQKEHDLDRIDTLMKNFAANYPEYLKLKADYQAVEDALKKVPEDLSGYTEASRANLQEAIDAVIYNLRAEDQKRVDGYGIAILKAIEALEPIPPTPDPIESSSEESTPVESTPSTSESDSSEASSTSSSSATNSTITVEKKPTDNNASPKAPQAPTSAQKAPKTGDTQNNTIWIALLIVCVGIIGWLAWMQKKKK